MKTTVPFSRPRPTPCLYISRTPVTLFSLKSGTGCIFCPWLKILQTLISSLETEGGKIREDKKNSPANKKCNSKRHQIKWFNSSQCGSGKSKSLTLVQLCRCIYNLFLSTKFWNKLVLFIQFSSENNAHCVFFSNMFHLSFKAFSRNIDKFGKVLGNLVTLCKNMLSQENGGRSFSPNFKTK